MFSLVWQRIQRKKCSPTPPKKKGTESLQHAFFDCDGGNWKHLHSVFRLVVSCWTSNSGGPSLYILAQLPIHLRYPPLRACPSLNTWGVASFCWRGGGEESNHLLVKHVCNMLLGKLTSPWCKVTSRLPSSKSYKPLHDSSSFVSIDKKKFYSISYCLISMGGSIVDYENPY